MMVAERLVVFLGLISVEPRGDIWLGEELQEELDWYINYKF